MKAILTIAILIAATITSPAEARRRKRNWYYANTPHKSRKILHPKRPIAETKPKKNPMVVVYF